MPRPRWRSRKAQLAQAEYNLSKTVIMSPFDGIVMARNVSIGQTVAASLQTPTLFTLATNLTDMQVDTSVDEADVGSVRKGASAQLHRDRLSRTSSSRDGPAGPHQSDRRSQNVVTYDAVVPVHDTSGKLLPGMTAQVTISVGKRTHVLAVPIAAVLYRPLAAPAAGGGGPRGGGSARGMVQSSGGARGPAVAGAPGSQVTVWVLQNGRPAAAAGGHRAFGRQERGDHQRRTAGRVIRSSWPSAAAAQPAPRARNGQAERSRPGQRAERGSRREAARGRRQRPTGAHRRTAAGGRPRNGRQGQRRPAATPPARRAGAVMTGAPLIEVQDLTKVYGEGPSAVQALRGVSLDGPPRRVRGDHGAVGLREVDVHAPPRVPGPPDLGLVPPGGPGGLGPDSRDELAMVRGRQIGFVFQSFNLLSRTSALENVELPMLYAGVAAEAARRTRAGDPGARSASATRMDHRPNELSGGQQQRVAIARALANDAPLLMADEPTGNLDSASSVEIMTLFQHLEPGQRHHRHRRDTRHRHAAWCGADRHLPRRVDRRRPLVAGRAQRTAPRQRGGLGMSFTVLIRTAWKALLRNISRSLLTMLGIIIGVGAVIASVAIGSGAQAVVLKQIESLGANLIVISPGSVTSGGVSLGSGARTSLKLDDVAAIEANVPEVAAAAPVFPDQRAGGGRRAPTGSR